MNRQPRIFVLSREYPPNTVGGTSTVARNLSTGLSARGWKVVVVTTRPQRSEDLREDLAGVTVHRTGTNVTYNQDSGVTDASVLTHRRLYQSAVRLAGEYGPPDVVALPDLFCYPEATLLSRRYGVPVVNVLLQDFRTLTPYDRDKHHVASGVSADRRHLYELEEKSLRGCAHTVFISAALSDAITGYYPGVATAHSVIHLGVDTAELGSIAGADADRARLRETLPATAYGRPLLVACGRLVPVKGFAPLLTALGRLGSAAPHLALVGVGPEEPHLRQLARTLDIEADVTFVGDVPRRTALTFMSMATVAVVPSLWESFCYVCAEMMALGRPVVATTVDSLNELMPSDEYGYRVAVTGSATGRRLDPGSLAAAIGSALGDPAEASRRGARARERMLSRFTNDRFARLMAELCGRLGSVTADG